MTTFVVKAEVLNDELEIEVTDDEMDNMTEEELQAMVDDKANDWVQEQVYYSIRKK